MSVGAGRGSIEGGRQRVKLSNDLFTSPPGKQTSPGGAWGSDNLPKREARAECGESVTGSAASSKLLNPGDSPDEGRELSGGAGS